MINIVAINAMKIKHILKTKIHIFVRIVCQKHFMIKIQMNV